MDTDTRKTKIVVISLFLLCGTISTFAYKLQSTQSVIEGTHTKKFFHPYMQSFTMFLGEFLCLLIYFSNRKKHSCELEPGKSSHHFTVFFIPALADACSSILQYTGLIFISGSTYMMFKGASIITTAIFSKILFNMKIERRHVVGCCLALIGITVVGASGLFDNNDETGSTFFVGYVLMVVSLVFNGFLYAYEQFLLRKHSINPMQMIGFEGMFGLFITSFVAMLLSLINCPFEERNCVYDSYNNGYIERIDIFFQESVSNYVLAIMLIGGILTIAVYNLNGVRITKIFDALTRALLNVTKTSVVWVGGIIVTISVDNKDYQLESLVVTVILVKAAGFVLIIIGTLIYNKLIFKNIFADREDRLKLIEGNEKDALIRKKEEEKRVSLLTENED